MDFRTSGKLNEVLGFLRSRPEVSGINSYRGGLIHIDFNANVRAAGLRTRPKPASDLVSPGFPHHRAGGMPADGAHRHLSPKNDSTAITTTISPTM